MSHALQIVKLPEVKVITGLSRSSIYKFIQDGSFPRQVPLGARAVGFFRHEVEQWLEGRAACRAQAGRSESKTSNSNVRPR